MTEHQKNCMIVGICPENKFSHGFPQDTEGKTIKNDKKNVKNVKSNKKLNKLIKKNKIIKKTLKKIINSQ